MLTGWSREVINNVPHGKRVELAPPTRTGRRSCVLAGATAVTGSETITPHDGTGRPVDLIPKIFDHAPYLHGDDLRPGRRERPAQANLERLKIFPLKCSKGAPRLPLAERRRAVPEQHTEAGATSEAIRLLLGTVALRRLAAQMKK